MSITPRVTLSAVTILFASIFVIAQTPPEPGAAPGVVLTNISKNTPAFGSVFPQVAVSRSNPNLVAVAWRRYGLPVDTNALKEARFAECHVALSKDGGQTFTDRNMMDVLRTRKSGTEPELWGCNAPWVTIANDGTLYFGGALFTAGGEIQADPKQGRAGVTVSNDGGATWSKMIPSVTLGRLAPGLKGLQGGMEPQHTPWDGPNGFVDPPTGTMYATVGAYITSSEDKGKSFGTVYQGKGTSSAAFGTLVAVRTVTDIQGYKCPCLTVSTSADKGVTWTEKVVAQADEYNREGTIRYPIPAASPANKGHYAVAVYQPDHRTIKVYYTQDGGKIWKMATPRPTPENISIATANQVNVGYTTDGRILVTWRGFRNPGAFNTFVAMLEGDTFGPTIKVSPELSIYPMLTYAGNYGLGNGAGDFTTWVQGNTTSAFVAFPLAIRGEIEDTYVARVPLTLLAAPKGPALSGDVLKTSRGDVVIHPVNHASFLMTWQGKTIYVDPIGGVAPYQEFPKPDLVMLTDTHGDHLHPDTLNAIVTPTTRIVAPPSVRKALPETLQTRVLLMANGDSTTVEDVGIEAIPMYNTTEERAQYHPKGRGNGYLMTFGDKRVYIMGDTEPTPEMFALTNVDIAFVPMNLPFTMTVQQAAETVRKLKPKAVYPYHSRGSDLNEFQRLVGNDSGVEVRLRKWY